MSVRRRGPRPSYLLPLPLTAFLAAGLGFAFLAAGAAEADDCGRPGFLTTFTGSVTQSSQVWCLAQKRTGPSVMAGLLYAVRVMAISVSQRSQAAEAPLRPTIRKVMGFEPATIASPATWMTLTGTKPTE